MSEAQAKTVIAPGTETCGCCDGIAASTPLGIDNRIEQVWLKPRRINRIGSVFVETYSRTASRSIS